MLSLLKVILLLLIILYLPGYPIARLIAGSRDLAVGAAPLMTIFVFLLMGVILGSLNVIGDIATCLMIAIPLILGVACLIAAKARRATQPVNDIHLDTIFQLVIYVCISLLVTYFVFIRGLGDVSNAIQESDNSAHLGSILEIAEDGNYSILKSSTYSLESIADESAPSLSYGFYPNAFHVIASFGVSILNATAPLAENATIVLFSGIIYPISSWVLLRKLFSKDERVVNCGALAVPAFSAFPFSLCTFGPLYPNLCSMCCMPLLCTLFMSIFPSSEEDQCSFRKRILRFVLASAAICAIQPNTIFATYIFLVPFCVHALFKYMRDTRSLSRASSILGCIGLSFAFIAIWTLLFYSPYFSSATTFHWPSLLDWKAGIANIVTLSLRLMVPQKFLAVLLVIGLITLTSKHGIRWIVASFIIMGGITYVDMVSDGFAQSYLSGFWYTDQWRTSACLAIVGVPLVAQGISSAVDLISSLIYRKSDKSITDRRDINLTDIASCLLIAIVLFSPVNIFSWPCETSALQYVKEQIHQNAAPSQAVQYSDGDREFVKKAKELISGNSLILNVPDDGSSYAYLSGDINTYYRSNRIPNETATSKLLRLHFSELDTNSDVQEAIRSNGISYIMLLDMSGYPIDSDEDSLWSLAGTFEKSMWIGLDSDALSKARSLNLLLTDGTRYLYKIDSSTW